MQCLHQSVEGGQNGVALAFGDGVEQPGELRGAGGRQLGGRIASPLGEREQVDPSIAVGSAAAHPATALQLPDQPADGALLEYRQRGSSWGLTAVAAAAVVLVLVARGPGR